jgi:hypothetical protein
MRGTRKSRPVRKKGTGETVASSPKPRVISEVPNSSEAHFDLDVYPRRRWSNSTDDYVAHLLDRLKKLYKQSHPRCGAESAKGKDHAAFDALHVAGDLVKAVAGWALDHQVGLALNGHEFVPMQPSGTKRHTDYLKARRAVDDHVHEKTGGGLHHCDFDPVVERQMMVNLLRGNSGGFNESLTGRAIGRLHAEIFRKTRAKRGPAAKRLQLKALAFVEYRYKAGLGKKGRIQEDVANQFCVSVIALRKWEKRLRDALGDWEVERELSFARNLASQVVHRRLAGAPVGSGERYGDDALVRAARAYQRALREKA